MHAETQSDFARAEILHIRHHSLFAPRDFDLSPWFQIVKPQLAEGFDPHRLVWSDASTPDKEGGQESIQAAHHGEPAEEPEPPSQRGLSIGGNERGLALDDGQDRDSQRQG